MTLQHGIPSHDTFRRVFALIDPEHLQKATTTFLIDNMKLIKRAFKIETNGLFQYCIDGKEAKGTGRNPGFEKDKIRNLQTLHVYDLSNGVITSYSIHYTKLYDISDRRSHVTCHCIGSICRKCYY